MDSATGLSADPANPSRLVRTLLIDNYDSYTYNLYQLIAEINGVEPVVVRNDELKWEELQERLAVGEFDNIVISPGPGSPEKESDIGVGLEVLRHAAEIPVLGVCLGHQALGLVHGGKVVHAPEPVHGRLSSIAHSGHALFTGIPQGAEVVRYHSLVVDAPSLPECLDPIAWAADQHGSGMKRLNSMLALAERAGNGNGVCGTSSAASSGEGLLMGVAHRSRPHFGIQFHPESIGTQYGIAILVNFRNITATLLGLPPQRSIADTFGPPGHTTGPRAWAGEAVKERGEPPPTLSLAWRREAGLLSEVGGSEALFLGLFGSELMADTFWLDSATAPERGRFSYMGGRGGPLWKRLLYRLPRVGSGSEAGSLDVEDANGMRSTLDTRLLDYLDTQLRLNRLAVGGDNAAALPFDFWGGYVGYLGYEMKAECGGQLAHDSTTPDAGLLLADRFVAVDHHTQDIYALALYPTESDASASQEWVDDTISAIRAMRAASCWDASGTATGTKADDAATAIADVAANGRSSRQQETGQLPPPFQLCHPREQYIDNVAACQRALHDGESYEICLTTALCRATAPSPFTLYRALRTLNPAPYAAWLAFGGEGGPTIACSSPERFLRCGRGGLLEAKPIKGTAPRVPDDPEADAAAAAELENNEKDRAENLMITDLLRNDLGRVCEVGSVHVPSLMAIESYATVHQLVSTVRGLRKPDSSIIDCLRATFPGGSMTGAPKVRTMEILDELEGRARGVYSGSLGYISFNGTFDLNIVIRTAVVHPGGTYIGAGGAIVVQSTTEGEYEEMRLKAKALMAAVGTCDRAELGKGAALPAEVDEHSPFKTLP